MCSPVGWIKKQKEAIGITSNIITIIGLLFIAIQLGQASSAYNLAKTTLEATVEPNISIYPQTIYQDDVSTVFTENQVAKLTLQNNFFGQLDGIKVYPEGVAIIQQRGTRDMWICGSDAGYFLPTATQTSLIEGQNFNFSVNVQRYTSQLAFYFEKFRNELAWLPFLRIRVKFYREVDKQPFVKDFYFVAYGPANGPIDEIIRYPGSEITEGGSLYTNDKRFLSEEEILAKLKDYITDDPRCSVFMYKKLNNP